MSTDPTSSPQTGPSTAPGAVTGTGRGSVPQSPARVRATFDGEPIEAEAGSSVAAAIMSSRGAAWRTTKSGTRRGLFCGIGVCYDCIVEIDGESGQRSCMIPLAEGMDVRPADGTRADGGLIATRSSRHRTPSDGSTSVASGAVADEPSGASAADATDEGEVSA